MRGEVNPQAKMFSYFSPESKVPADHPLRTAREGICVRQSAVLEVGNHPGIMPNFRALSTGTKPYKNRFQSPIGSCFLPTRNHEDPIY